MKITVIHGQMHQGSTYHITKELLRHLQPYAPTVQEFFLPKDGPDFCVGCFQCFEKSEKLCPHAAKMTPIIDSMTSSDLIVMDSPTYCLSMTGQLKTFLDHLAFMWLPHRPSGAFFKKKAIVISTTAGMGAKSVTKSLSKQLFYLGISHTVQYRQAVNALSWDTVSEKLKLKIEKDMHKIALNSSKSTNPRPKLKLRGMFFIMKQMQKSNKWNPADRNHWIENGWLNGKKPW